MRELVVILPDFFSVSVDERAAAAAAAVLPRLPRLEGLLARARHAMLPAADWRRWLRERLGLVASQSAAAIVAGAWELPTDPARQYWLATPVHLFAGLDSVRLHPQGLLWLTASEQRRLVQEFAAVFHDSPWSLIARDRRELLLLGPPLQASGADPATLLGADPSAGLPRGADAAMLRRLVSEIELWLHEHPLNLERQRRSQLPVTALWLWGGEPAARGEGALPTVPAELAPGQGARAPLPQLLGEDTYLEALWKLCGAEGSAALEPAAALSAEGGAVLLQRVCEAPGLTPALERLEKLWWAPALAALRARRLAGLHLVTAERVHSLTWWSLARFWRARRPWWELL